MASMSEPSTPDLFRNDPQLMYSWQSVKRYNAPLQHLDDDRKSGHKRHIISVDDHLKINYEVVKNIPGNLIDLGSLKNKKTSEMDEVSRINKFRSLYYKEELNKFHDDFATKSSDLRAASDAALRQTLTDFIGGSNIPLEQQYVWLKEIQNFLFKQYQDEIQIEKSWYLRKEILLDANIKLDLFSSIDNFSGNINSTKENLHKSCIF